jgi:MerR family transcriptional regulator, light-induced transcriptional regulator
MGDGRNNDAPDTRDARLEEFGRVYLSALLTGDHTAAEVTIREAIDAELTPEEIDDEIIAPALWYVGELWARGELSVAQEHLATEISVRVLALHREARRFAAARAGHRVMLATPSGELHVVALRMIDDLMRDAGYDVLMLGADVPPDSLADLAVRLRPRVICLSSTMPGGVQQVLHAIETVRGRRPGAAFVVGGRGVASNLRARPGIDICRRVSEVVEAVDAMVKRADLN